MSNFYVISPTNQDESDDLVSLVKLWGKDYFLYSPNVFVKHRYLNKILETFYFLHLILNLKKVHKNIEILGVPCLRNRISSVLLNVPLTYYFRYLHPNPEKLAFLSDKLDFYFKKLGFNNKLTNHCFADRHLVTSHVTRDFLLARKITKNIIDVPPLWLKNIKIKKIGRKKRIFFITQAFAEHDMQSAAQGQRIFIEKLKLQLDEMDRNLILKVHPRDLDDYQGYAKFNGDAISFLNEVSTEDIIITPFSTMAFELVAIGANVKFIIYEGIEFYEMTYHRYNIKYFKPLSLEFLDEPRVDYKIFNSIDTEINDE